MKTVTILCFDNAFSSVITGLLDLFSLVGVTWNRIQGKPIEAYFKVVTASADGRSVRCLNGLTIQPDYTVDKIRYSDLIFVPPIGGGVNKTLVENKALIDWLIMMNHRGSQIASSCTGTFLLAATGLLDEKRATTHWGYVDRFRELFPRVDLKPRQLITNELNLFCAGGGNAWIDLALFLVEQHLGHDIAVETAKGLVIERKMPSQGPYSTLSGQKYHKDEAILAAQEWMEEHLTQKIAIDQLGTRFGMSSRTFKRRFKQATGDTPIAYLQSLRIESAKKILESTRLPIEQVIQQVGYQDSSSFMKLFKRITGVSPHSYRMQFSRRPSNSEKRATPHANQAGPSRR